MTGTRTSMRTSAPARLTAAILALALSSMPWTVRAQEEPTPVVKPDAKTEVSAPPEEAAKKAVVQMPIIDKKQKYFTLNFKDVDISEFVGIMSQLLKKNIVIDEKVRGKITISSSKKIPVSQAYEILKSILELKGFSVVETENLIKVLPIQSAIKKNVEIITDGKKRMPPDEDKTITYIHEVEFASANEIANVLRSLKSGFVDLVVYQPLNIIVLSGTGSEINGLVKIARSLDKKVEEAKDPKLGRGNIHVVHLENANAEQLAGVLARVPFSEQAKIDTSPIQQQQQVQTPQSGMARRVTQTQPTAAATKPTTKLSIIANKETNSLIITATPDEFAEIYRIIKELDVVREQVLIEAIIVEVSADNGWVFGIDWMLGSNAGDYLYGGSSIMGTPPDYTVPSALAGKKIPVPLAANAFQLGFLSDKTNLGFLLLSASATDKRFNLLSTPQILTVDNQEAEINVGEDIPVVSNNRISESGTQFYTYEYKSVGVKLKITPHITMKERITLDLYQEVNSVLGATTVSSSGTVIPPKLGKRDIKTKITVQDGKTVVVGGLIRNEKSVEETKVPLLGDIPILGWLFKRRSVEYNKTNLLVFITPHVVTRQERIDAITEQKLEEQRRLKIKE